SGGGSRSGAAGRRTTSRLLDVQFPPYQKLWPTEFAAEVEVPVAPLVEAVKRVALVAERGTPVRMEFADGGVTLSAGGDDEGRAGGQRGGSTQGEPRMGAVNPRD